MAAQDKASRTEKPTGKRLAKARKEGQVARSVELNHTAVLVAVIAVLSFEAPSMLAKMEAIVHDGLARSGSPQLVGGPGLHALTFWGMRSFAGVCVLLVLATPIARAYVQGSTWRSLDPPAGLKPGAHSPFRSRGAINGPG